VRKQGGDECIALQGEEDPVADVANVDVDVHVDVFGILFRSLVCPETGVHVCVHDHVHVYEIGSTWFHSELRRAFQCCAGVPILAHDCVESPAWAGQTALKGLHHRAQGWPRFLRPTLGKGAIMQSTLKGLRPNPIHSAHPIPSHVV
jgi:hypothetical protein